MKQLLLLIFNILWTVFVWAQAPMQINYQGIARNSGGNLLTNQNIGLRLSIHNGSASGTVLYHETRSLKTNRFGMFVVAIGSPGAFNVGSPISSIDWSVGGGKFLQVELSPNDNNNFTNMGAAELLSVPYALLAESAYPIGQAGGDLTGLYPFPTIANGVVFTSKLADSAVTTPKIKNGSITLAKLAPGLMIAGPPTGPAGGDLTGLYPIPAIANGVVFTSKLADSAVTTPKIKNGSITLAKLAPGLMIAGPPTGPAGGDLTGLYPIPAIANGVVFTSKLADSAVTTPKIKDGSITLAKLAPGLMTGGPPTGPAGGDLSGTFPNPSIANNAISTVKLVDQSVTTAKIADRSLTLAKFTLIPAGGDLTGLYPIPTIANGVVFTSKLADSAVTTPKIKDGSITLAKLAPGITIGGSTPTGPAGGDLAGTYPNPDVNKLKGTSISNLVPAAGQVLKFDGIQWSPAMDNTGNFSIPYSSFANSASNLFSITNQGSGTAIEGINSSANPNATGIFGKISSTAPGIASTAVRGMNNGNGPDGYGIWGSHNGSGSGVYGSSIDGVGVNGSSTGGNGVNASSSTGSGIFATSNEGIPGLFDISNPASFNDAVFVSNEGSGNGVTAISNLSNGILAIGNDAAGTGLLGINNAGGEAILGYTISDYASAVIGRNDGAFAGVNGLNTANNGIGVLAIANSNGAINGTALVAEIEGPDPGNTAVFKANNSNVARIDNTGKGFFNGGTQLGGADIAEFFDVEGSYTDYEPGDVLIISQSSDRRVERSSSVYSTLIAGVYATNPGVLLTEKNAEQDALKKMVPMGMIGVLPTKVCLEGGSIMRGDLLVTSSIRGVAMKADPKKIQVGQVLGKALQSYNEKGVGKINVLVSIK